MLMFLRQSLHLGNRISPLANLLGMANPSTVLHVVGRRVRLTVQQRYTSELLPSNLAAIKPGVENNGPMDAHRELNKRLERPANTRPVKSPFRGFWRVNMLAIPLAYVLSTALEWSRLEGADRTPLATNPVGVAFGPPLGSENAPGDDSRAHEAGMRLAKKNVDSFFAPSLNSMERADFLLSPALLLQEALSKDVIITYPEN